MNPMRVGFYHVGPSKVHEAFAAQLIASCRAAMPTVRIAQLTDEETKTMKGIDFVVRLPLEPVALGCLGHYKALEGDWLLVDTDVIIQSDVRDVFRRDFHVAVATREGTLLQKEVGTKFMERNKYNKGVVFSRSPEFWKHAYQRCLELPAGRQRWMGDQMAMNDVIATGRWNVEVLPNRFNYPPKMRSEDVRDKAILHLKGHRKEWFAVH